MRASPWVFGGHWLLSQPRVATFRGCPKGLVVTAQDPAPRDGDGVGGRRATAVRAEQQPFLLSTLALLQRQLSDAHPGSPGKPACVLIAGLFWPFLSLFLFKFIFGERGMRGERREQGCLSHAPNQGSGPQPRHEP